MRIDVTLIEGKDFNKNTTKEHLEFLCKKTKELIEKRFFHKDEITVGYRGYVDLTDLKLPPPLNGK